jgi:ATP-dependent RNA helicase DDX24/MAK5
MYFRKRGVTVPDEPIHCRFASVHSSVLLATDIAARGLDIPNINHVIHYQIPRSADAYVHRKGRTARAMKKGFSLLMCAPDEAKLAKGLMNSLKRGGFDFACPRCRL